MRAGLDRASKLLPGTGYAELTAGLVKPWAEGLGGYVRGELGMHLNQGLSAFAFAEATLQGGQAGVGARLSW